MTPFLIHVEGGSFDQYLKSLSKHARGYYKKAKKRNSDLIYERVSFDPELVKHFMGVWARQISNDHKIRWPYKFSYVEYLASKNKLLCFCARERSHGKIICLQFVEHYDNYIVCAAPMYDKHKYLDRTIAKYMLFNLIKYATNHARIEWVDLGAWGNRSWRKLVHAFNQGTCGSYKWQFIPADIKKDPLKAEPFILRRKILSCSVYLDLKMALPVKVESSPTTLRTSRPKNKSGDRFLKNVYDANLAPQARSCTDITAGFQSIFTLVAIGSSGL